MTNVDFEAIERAKRKVMRLFEAAEDMPPDEFRAIIKDATIRLEPDQVSGHPFLGWCQEKNVGVGIVDWRVILRALRAYVLRNCTKRK